MDGAFKYVEQYGLCSSIEYPYTATQSTCINCNKIVYISSCYDVKSNDQISLKNAVAITPVSVAIEADTFYFQSYSGGILDSPQCGSCWAFSATGAIESSWAISKGELINLSEQELVDCATGIKYGGHGCNGGQMDGAFKYVEQFGLCSDIEYPYSATQTSCTKCEQIVYISSCYDVKSNDQLSLKNAVAISPVSVAIEADTFYFQSYSGGILDSPQCGTNLDHGVLIVGYGTENRLDYWIVKNSWGENWGMNGYVKILKSNSTNDPGICGIAIQPSFPII
jgi:C1A family cysteine protease